MESSRVDWIRWNGKRREDFWVEIPTSGKIGQKWGTQVLLFSYYWCGVV
jgi:hypothetical protein